MTRLCGEALCHIHLIRIGQDNAGLRENVEEFIEAPEYLQVFTLYSYWNSLLIQFNRDRYWLGYAIENR